MAWIIKDGDDILGVFTSLEAAAMQTEISGDLSEVTDVELQLMQRAWRDKELEDTDWIIPITDHSERSIYITYRQELRDWPAQTSFPNTRPTI